MFIVSILCFSLSFFFGPFFYFFFFQKLTHCHKTAGSTWEIRTRSKMHTSVWPTAQVCFCRVCGFCLSDGGVSFLSFRWWSSSECLTKADSLATTHSRPVFMRRKQALVWKRQLPRTTWRAVARAYTTNSVRGQQRYVAVICILNSSLLAWFLVVSIALCWLVSLCEYLPCVCVWVCSASLSLTHSLSLSPSPSLSAYFHP